MLKTIPDQKDEIKERSDIVALVDELAQRLDAISHEVYELDCLRLRIKGMFRIK